MTTSSGTYHLGGVTDNTFVSGTAGILISSGVVTDTADDFSVNDTLQGTGASGSWGGKVLSLMDEINSLKSQLSASALSVFDW